MALIGSTGRTQGMTLKINPTQKAISRASGSDQFSALSPTSIGGGPGLREAGLPPRRDSSWSSEKGIQGTREEVSAAESLGGGGERLDGGGGGAGFVSWNSSGFCGVTFSSGAAMWVSNFHFRSSGK